MARSLSWWTRTGPSEATATSLADCVDALEDPGDGTGIWARPKEERQRCHNDTTGVICSCLNPSCSQAGCLLSVPPIAPARAPNAMNNRNTNAETLACSHQVIYRL